MQQSLRNRLFVSFSLLLLLTLACQSLLPGDDATDGTIATREIALDPTVPPPTELPVEPTEAAVAEPTEATPDEPLADRQLLILPGGEPPTLDPHLSGDATSAEYVVEIFSGLMTYDLDLNLIPDLAESYEISEDGLVYTFKIRENAQFQNGKPVRAGDFKWSFERACDPNTKSRTASTYLGDIIGCQDKLDGLASEVIGIKVIDDLTLELTIDSPKAFFLAKMSYPTAYVLDQETVESSPAWFLQPNGSGPFTLADYSPGAPILALEQNPNYYRNPKPTLERVAYLIDVPVRLMNGYEENLGEYSTELSYSAIPVGTDNLDKATDPNNPLSQEFVSVDSLSIFYMGFNVNQPPFDDPKVRQAFNLALDKRRLVRLAFRGAVQPAHGIVPPSMPGYENPDLSDFEFDPERAVALIEESSYGDVSELPPITLYISGVGGGVSPVIEAMVEAYRTNLGVEISVEQAIWEQFLEDLHDPSLPYQMYQLGWVADYPDPQNFLDVLFHSQSGQNHGRYSNPEVDALLDEARATQEEAARQALYRQAEQLILKDAAWVPIYFDVDNWLVKPYVKNLIIPPMKIPRLQYVSILEH